MKLIDFCPEYSSQADPYLIRGEDGNFYMYVTGTDGVHAFVASTLTGKYKHAGVVFSLVNHKQYWAPSVIFMDGKYYMYVSCMPQNSDDAHTQAMHVACSDNPLGPFDNAKQICEPFSIDSHVVKNENGLFLFYSVNDYEAQRAGTYIVVDRLLDPYTPEGKPVAVVKPTLDEEIFMRDRFKKGQHWHTLEGAFYFNEGDYHYLIYSGNCYMNEYYYLGYAVAKTSERDLTKIKFEKYPDENTYAPLICKNSFEAGTGHNSVIKVDGEYYAIYHGRDVVKDERLTGDDRTARICKLVLDGKKMIALQKKDEL